MSKTPSTVDLRAGIETTPTTGIYVVQLRSPAHAQPHEVRIADLMIRPKCCADVRFSLRRPLLEKIEDCEFFRDSIPPTKPRISLARAAGLKVYEDR